MEKKFKPFERIIYKVTPESKWDCDLYSFYDEDRGYHITMNHTLKDSEILPYEGNEHLVGSQDEPDEEIRLEEGELIFYFDEIEDLEVIDIYLARFDRVKDDKIFIKLDYFPKWNFAIRFKDFDPSNMEETRKKILCVKDGRIIRYKG